MLCLLMAFSLVALPLTAKESKEAERLDNCGTVLKEILDIPDDIPSDLLDKAECVIVIPSVLKLAVGFSGSYGRDRKSTRLNSSHRTISYAVFCLKKKNYCPLRLPLGTSHFHAALLVAPLSLPKA